jgi:threonine aldolase
MREAMARAEVGDDVYGEDPTVQRLQQRAAERIGVEAALFVPSGTMANQLALRVLTRPGDLVLAGENAHVLLYEGGAASALSGLQINVIGRGGLFDGTDVRRAVTPDEAHYARTRVVALENTHNRAGGRVFPLELAKDVAGAARERGVAVHLDGARIFNAEIATGTPASAWAQLCDTVSFCLSKGLGAPVGSLVCGTRERLRELHRARKQLGGGMRQAGVLAAAALYALDHHVERLAQDHALAQRLADGLQGIPALTVEPPQTNMVFVDAQGERAAGLVEHLKARGVLATGLYRLRFVTHLDVDAAAIDHAVAAVHEHFNA